MYTLGTLDGNKIVAEQRGDITLYYLYDDTDSIMGISYGDNTYTFAKNIQGDVIGIYSGGALVAKYEYNAYGQILSITNASGANISNNATHIANLNPFRYRGYYYDTETGFYYLQSRYYDPVVGRFLNADAFVSTGQGILGNNMFAYCGNNPIRRIDIYGTWFLEDAWNWTNKNIVQPATKFVDEEIVQPVVEFVDDEIVEPVTDVANNVIEDISNLNPANKSEQKVFEANYFSCYKGVPVIYFRHEDINSFSFGGIFLNEESRGSINTLNHEYGHTRQFKRMGIRTYTKEVAIPSLLLNVLDDKNKLTYDYYSYPWEAEADSLGGVTRVFEDPPLPKGGYKSYWDLIKLFF